MKTEEDLGRALRFSNFERLIVEEESENKIGKEKSDKKEKNQKNAQKLREKSSLKGRRAVNRVKSIEKSNNIRTVKISVRSWESMTISVIDLSVELLGKNQTDEMVGGKMRKQRQQVIENSRILVVNMRMNGQILDCPVSRYASGKTPSKAGTPK